MATEMPGALDGRSPAGYPSSIHSNLGKHLVLMCASALFTGLTQRECTEIVSCGRARTFARNELLYTQGQPMRSLIFLQSGSVKHTQLSATGNEVLLWMSGSGEALNVQTETTSCGHSCSARAMEQCNALVWDYTRLRTLLDQYPQIRKNISKILASQLEELEERFRELATETVAKRLALVLLRLTRRVGKVSHGGTQIFLSREELGQMTGTTLFTISRILSKWAERGIVVPRREAVLVSNPKGLESIGDEPEWVLESGDGVATAASVKDRSAPRHGKAAVKPRSMR
jgi:CRP/FNR family transcriptional regulator, nitrogen oxide reductase regulator